MSTKAMRQYPRARDTRITEHERQSPDPGAYQAPPEYVNKVMLRKKQDEKLLKRASDRVRLPLQVDVSINPPSKEKKAIEELGVGFGSSAGKLDNPSEIQKIVRAKNYSIPSIPSRFLTPVLELDINKNSGSGVKKSKNQQKKAEPKTGETVTETFLSARV